MIKFLFTCLIFCSSFSPASLNAFENGHLEIFEEQKIVYLKGSPYEIGFQHGALLKPEILKNIHRFIEGILQSNSPKPTLITQFLEAVPKIIPYIPSELMDEMHGIADATEIPFQKILLLNLFPEMFHCTGMTLNESATQHGELYHVRVLDYASGKGLQDTAVLLVVEPSNGIPFLNVTYAGFIGSITGMNQEKIAIGEIGGKGYGQWFGLPMAFLLRHILQQASSLEDIKKILEDNSRTCEYYYVFSDGKTGKSFAAYATPEILTYLVAGQQVTKEKNHSSQLFFDQPKDMMIISKEECFNLLNERLAKNLGQLSVKDLIEALKYPIAHNSNLHNAIFAPGTLDVWISHAGKLNTPACDEPYHHFNLNTLLGK